MFWNGEMSEEIKFVMYSVF